MSELTLTMTDALKGVQEGAVVFETKETYTHEEVLRFLSNLRLSIRLCVKARGKAV